MTRIKNFCVGLLPFLIVLIFYGFFLIFVMPPFPSDLAGIGSFGDGFGPVSSLFSALGIAGLVVTIFIQQRQILHQIEYSQKQDRDSAVRQYEETLFRLLELYKTSLAAVIAKKGSGVVYGIDALQTATESALKLIRTEKVNHVPSIIQKRRSDDRLNSNDREILEFLYYKNFRILNFAMARQGRLVSTLKVLLRHLEKSAPSHIVKDNYRALVLSQFTYAEVTYFLFVALAYNDEKELRELMAESTLLKKAKNTSFLQVHRYMYKDYWGYNLNENVPGVGFPIAHRRVKYFKSHDAELHLALDAAFAQTSSKETE